MAEIKAVVQIFEGCPLEELSVPDLSEREKRLAEDIYKAYFEAMQWEVLVLINDTGGAAKNRGSAVDALILSHFLSTAGAFGEGCVVLKAVTANEFVQYNRHA